MVALVKIWYHDHHSQQRQSPEESIEPPSCVNWACGEVVHEDKDWIRICHEKNNMTLEDEGNGNNETWEITTIRKVDIIKKEY